MRNAPSLPELQRQFAAVILGEDSATLEDIVLGKGLTPEARLKIYRNIVLNNHAAALRTAYPVVLRLVGEDFFMSAAARYLRDYPTSSGNLQDYGINFPEFLAKLPEAGSLAYLPDVARLEWARQKSYLATDVESISLTALDEVTEPESLRLDLHPSLRLVTSVHPILDIWQFCQQSAPEHLELSGQPQSVLLWRDGFQIAMQESDTGSCVLIAALLHRTPLAAAHAEALRSAEDFDLSTCLHWLFTTGLVTGLTPNENV